jgi:Protein of unknown function (DUF559)
VDECEAVRGKPSAGRPKSTALPIRQTKKSPAMRFARRRSLRKGYDVLRFTNEDVFCNLDGVLETIRMRLIELRPRLQDSSI